MSDFAATVLGLQRGATGSPCQTCAILEKLDETDAAALRTVLEAPKAERVGAETLVLTLRDLGFKQASRNSVEKHRREQHG